MPAPGVECSCPNRQWQCPRAATPEAFSQSGRCSYGRGVGVLFISLYDWFSVRPFCLLACMPCLHLNGVGEGRGARVGSERCASRERIFGGKYKLSRTIHHTSANISTNAIWLETFASAAPRYALTDTNDRPPILLPTPTNRAILRLPIPILLRTSITPSHVKKLSECHRHASAEKRGSRPVVKVSQVNQSLP